MKKENITDNPLLMLFIGLALGFLAINYLGIGRLVSTSDEIITPLFKITDRVVAIDDNRMQKQCVSYLANTQAISNIASSDCRLSQFRSYIPDYSHADVVETSFACACKIR